MSSGNLNYRASIILLLSFRYLLLLKFKNINPSHRIIAPMYDFVSLLSSSFKVTYRGIGSTKSPLYNQFGSDVIVRFVHLDINADVITILHLQPFVHVLLGRQTQDSLSHLDLLAAEEEILRHSRAAVRYRVLYMSYRHCNLTILILYSY